MSHDVFISYSTADRTVAEAICSRLEGGGIRCWMAPRDITPGADWGEAILQAIAGCQVMVLVLSSHANGSQQVRREVERAVHHARAIVPFRIEDVHPSGSLEYYLSTQHWLDAIDPPLERNIDHLARTCRSLLNRQNDAPQPVEERNRKPAAAPAAPRKRSLIAATAALTLLALLAWAFWPGNSDNPPDPVPQVDAIEPAPGSQDVPVDLKWVRIEFSTPMQRNLPSLAALPDCTLPPLAESSPVQWVTDRRLEILLGPLDASTEYGLRIGAGGRGLQSADGRQVPGVDVTFSTVFDIHAMTRIAPDATWQEVVGKARALRKLGYVPEAVQMYARYGDRFSASDPTARQYSETAQQFTRQIQRLEVQGGLYVYDVVADSPAAKAGLQVGDVIIGLGGQPTPDADGLERIRQEFLREAEMRVNYLRRDRLGHFERRTAVLPNAPMGLRLMPI
ncbi:MAG: TIR domain-containing protein [Planctomycetota bacterium]